MVEHISTQQEPDSKSQVAREPVSDEMLSLWRKENQRLLQDDDEIAQQPTKIELGLRLLSEFKNVQDDLQMKSILADALYGENPVKNYTTAIEQLADQATLNGYYGLQDACLMIAEALHELPKEGSQTSLPQIGIPTLDDWPMLIRAYLQEPNPTAISKIINVLRHPDLHLQISENEFAILETLLTEGLNVKKTASPDEKASVIQAEVSQPVKVVEQILPVPQHRPINDYISSIGQLAKQAAIEEYHGLQNVCLLLVEALHELPKEPLPATTIELLSSLDDWSTLVDAYKEGSETAITQLIAILRHPDLNLFLSDDEFTMLEHLLAEDIGIVSPAQHHEEPSSQATELLDTNAYLSLAEYISIIEQLADHIAHDGDYCLQDACLLLVEALRELPADDDFSRSSELLSMLAAWQEIITDYHQNPQPAIAAIIKTLRHPQLNCQLTEEEFSALETLLAESVQTGDEVIPVETITLDTYITKIEQHADHIALAGYYALQDANLLLAETLRELSPDAFSSQTTLPALLEQWLTLVDAYQFTPQTAIPALLAILHSEQLQLPLADDEFVMLENALVSDCAANADTSTISENEPLDLEDNTIDEIPEPAKLTLDDYIRNIEQHADQVAARGYYALQDANLLLAETLRELSPDAFSVQTSLPTLLEQWLSLVEAYQLTPQTAIPAILGILHSEQLQLPLADDEFIMLENALVNDCAANADADVVSNEEIPAPADDSATTESPAANKPVRDNYIHAIEQLADQVAAEGYYALQDANLLVVEALHEMSPDEFADKIELSRALNQWAELVEAYKAIPQIAIPEILRILRSADLQLPLADDEFTLLETALIEGSGMASEWVLPISDETPSKQSFEEEAVIDTKPASEEQNLARFETAINTAFAIEASDADTTPADIISIEPESESVNEIVNEVVVEPIVEVKTTTPPPKTNTNHPLSKAALELVELLVMEAEMVSSHLAGISVENASTVANGLEQVDEELERYSNASTMAGFNSLAAICKHVATNVQTFREQSDAFTADKLLLLQTWVEQVKNYLTSFTENDAGSALLAQLRDPNWASPLTAEASAACAAQMQASSKSIATLQEPTRKQTVSNDDISLTIPSDVNKELLDILLQELPSYMQQFSEALQRLQSGGSAQDVEVAQRVAHTIKGSANTVGVKGIAVLTHHLEDILLVYAKEHKLPKGAIINSLINATDCLESMTESLLGLSEAPSEAKTVLQEILDWANQIDQNGIPENDEDAPAPRDIGETTATEKAPPSPETTTPQETAQTQAAQVAMVRVPTDQIENLFRLSSESIILNGQTFERHRRIKNQMQAMEAQFILLQQLGAELDQLIDLKDLSGRSLMPTGKDFDALEMDQYNELHTASRRMVEAAVDAHELSIDIKKELELMSGVLDYQQRLVIDTQESVMQTRLIPVVSIVPRLQRGVRQTCRLTGKQCDLILSGEQLLIDGDTLNAMVDPLMHLLRNAIDHGIESDEDRAALGKPLTGKITIEFDREGNSILVRVRDDGKGLDYEAIRATAEKRGALQVGQAASEDELKRFILQPNFSTRDYSTQTSGRGVGMDAVRFQVINLGGTLTLNSTKGQGMTVELRIPLPLSRSHALLANVCHHKVAITSKGLLQIVYSGAGELNMQNNGQVLIIGDDVYPVVKLEDLLHVTEHRKDPRPHTAVLLVQTEDKTTAVLVSAISDSRDVVIKSLGHYMGKIQGFIGATILGDGSVIPVLDVPELLRTPMRAAQRAGTTHTEEFDAHANLPSVLVVDDSLSQRRALEQILQDAGYKVHIARDGIEAVEFLSHAHADVVLTDLEMPRMNGIELISHIRTQARTKQLPTIMITSRTTQKHRQMAEEAGVNFYLVKPVQDDDLLAKIDGLINKTQQSVSA